MRSALLTLLQIFVAFHILLCFSHLAVLAGPWLFSVLPTTAAMDRNKFGCWAGWCWTHWECPQALHSLGKLLHCPHSFLLHRQPQAALVSKCRTKGKNRCGMKQHWAHSNGTTGYLHQHMSTALPLPIPIHT